jgi:hypothetical protein
MGLEENQKSNERQKFNGKADYRRRTDVFQTTFGRILDES